MSKTVLQPAELRAMLRTFKEQHAGGYHLLALGYFGSHARNEATPESDVDVVFQIDRPDLFITAMLRTCFEIFRGQRESCTMGLRARRFTPRDECVDGFGEPSY